MSNSSIWLRDRTQSNATTQGQSGSGSDGNEGVLQIPQSSSITEASPSDFLVSYQGHSLGESYLSAEIQSVYSAVPADWAHKLLVLVKNIWNHITVCKLFALRMVTTSSNCLQMIIIITTYLKIYNSLQEESLTSALTKQELKYLKIQPTNQPTN